MNIKKRIRTEDTNPGPGALFSVRIPISTKKNNKETINETAKNTHSVDNSCTIILSFKKNKRYFKINLPECKISKRVSKSSEINIRPIFLLLLSHINNNI